MDIAFSFSCFHGARLSSWDFFPLFFSHMIVRSVPYPWVVFLSLCFLVWTLTLAHPLGSSSLLCVTLQCNSCGPSTSPGVEGPGHGTLCRTYQSSVHTKSYRVWRLKWAQEIGLKFRVKMQYCPLYLQTSFWCISKVYSRCIQNKSVDKEHNCLSGE